MFPQLNISEYIPHALVTVLFAVYISEYVRARLLHRVTTLHVHVYTLGATSFLFILGWLALDLLSSANPLLIPSVRFSLVLGSGLLIAHIYTLTEHYTAFRHRILLAVFLISGIGYITYSYIFLYIYTTQLSAWIYTLLRLSWVLSLSLLALLIVRALRIISLSVPVNTQWLTQRFYAYFIIPAVALTWLFTYIDVHLKEVFTPPEVYENLTIMYPNDTHYALELADSFIADREGYLTEKRITLFENRATQYLTPIDKVVSGQALLGLVRMTDALDAFMQGRPITIIASLSQRDLNLESSASSSASSTPGVRYVLIAEQSMVEFGPGVIYDYLAALYQGSQHYRKNPQTDTAAIIASLFPRPEEYREARAATVHLHELMSSNERAPHTRYGEHDTAYIDTLYAEKAASSPEALPINPSLLYTDKFLPAL